MQETNSPQLDSYSPLPDNISTNEKIFNYKKIIVIGISCILIFIILITVIVAFSQTSKEDTINQQITVSKSASETIISPIITQNFIWKSDSIKPPPVTDSRGWETYTNPVNKFSFKYPSTMILIINKKTTKDQYDLFFVNSAEQKDRLLNCIASSGTPCNNYSLAMRFETLMKPQGQNMTDFLKEYYDQNSTEFAYITIGGYPALERQLRANEIKNNIYIEHNTSVLYIFAVSANSPQENMDAYQKILSTFTFLD